MKVLNIFFISFMIIINIPTLNADTYKYTDKNGIITFTSDINYVPKEYRDKVEVIKEEKDVNKDITPVKRSPSSIANTQIIDNKYSQNQEPTKTLWNKYEKFFLPEVFLFILSSLFFIFANKILFFIENKRVIALSRVAVVLVFLIFVFSKYANKQVETFLDAKKDIDKIKKSIETKDVKIDRLTK